MRKDVIYYSLMYENIALKKYIGRISREFDENEEK